MPKVASVLGCSAATSKASWTDLRNCSMGGDDGNDGVGVAFLEDGGAEADGVGRIAAGGLAQKVFLGQLGEVGQDGVAIGGAGADVDAVGRQKSAQAFITELKQASAADERQELLRLFLARERPKPRSRPTRHDQPVLHSSCIDPEGL